MTDRRCLVAICHNGPVVLTRTAQSLMELGWGNRVDEAKAAHGFVGIDFMWAQQFPRVDAMRDWAAERARRSGRYSHLLFLDADMVWPTDVLLRMLAHHDAGGIVSGHYCLKGGSHNPVALINGRTLEGDSITRYDYDLDFAEADGKTDAAGLRDVEVVGMGCTLIPMAVFDALGPRPWFAYEADADGWPVVSEDVPFCRAARAAGFRVAWNPSIECGHADVKVITPRWHRASADGTIAAMLEMVKAAGGRRVPMIEARDPAEVEL